MRQDGSHRRRRARWLAVLALAACCWLASAAAAQAAKHYPVIYNFPSAIAIGDSVRPTPLGSNDWTCRPTRAHRNPVVLVPALGGDIGSEWQAASPLLANNGYCVFAFDYRDKGHAHIPAVARDLAAFVHKVLARTGSSRVDIVGHSQGGMLPRYYLKFLGGARKVQRLVGITPINHGTTLAGLGRMLASNPATSKLIASQCPACLDLVAHSPFMRRLNAGGDTVPGVSYTVIGTRYEDVVTPYKSVFLKGRRVTNILLQHQCRTDLIDHPAANYDSIALHDMLNALDPKHATRPKCTLVLPGVGG
jgi:triacylglycerol esterase/lipase EstA (alpha/beta hydrolase family)